MGVNKNEEYYNSSNAHSKHTLTNVSVTQHFQQAGLLAARGRGEGGGQLVEVELPDVQRDICG